MLTLIEAAATTVIGIIGAFAVARYYYAKTATHRLAIYVVANDGAFETVAPSVRREMSLQFRGIAVEDLNVLDMLIENQGAAVSLPIRPLKFRLDGTARAVSASIAYARPAGLDIAIEIKSDRELECIFPLLNPGDYFVVRIVTDGPVASGRISATIIAPDLPPQIEIFGRPPRRSSHYGKIKSLVAQYQSVEI